MAFFVNLEKISIEQYEKKLKKADLIPSRMILKEGVEKNFSNIKKQNIKNVDELLGNLRNKEKTKSFAEQSGVSIDYLTVLSRELRAYKKTAGRMKDYPDISSKTIKALEEISVKRSDQLYEKVLTSKDRKAFSKQTGIDEKEILRLTRLTDISRVRWVNENFARVLLEAGYDTTEKLAQADYKEVY